MLRAVHEGHYSYRIATWHKRKNTFSCVCVKTRKGLSRRAPGTKQHAHVCAPGTLTRQVMHMLPFTRVHRGQNKTSKDKCTSAHVSRPADLCRWRVVTKQKENANRDRHAPKPQNIPPQQARPVKLQTLRGLAGQTPPIALFTLFEPTS